MLHGWHKSVSFTRGQLAELSGVSDGILSFWLKNGVLRATEGGHGRGSHRRFTAFEVSIAGILGSLQPYGLKLASLRSLADLFHAAVDLCHDVKLHPYSMLSAAHLARDLHRFRSGEDFECHRYIYDEKGNSKELFRAKVERESDLYEDIREIWSDHDPPENIISFAHTLKVDDHVLVQIFQDFALEMFGVDVEDTGWFVWQDTEGKWNILSQADGSFSGFPDSETAIFIAVGKIIRRIWNIDFDAMREARAYKTMLAQQRIARRRAKL